LKPCRNPEKRKKIKTRASNLFCLLICERRIKEPSCFLRKNQIAVKKKIQDCPQLIHRGKKSCLRVKTQGVSILVPKRRGEPRGQLGKKWVKKNEKLGSKDSIKTA